MDGSGGAPPSSHNTAPVPPLLTPLRLISLGQLFDQNQPPSLFRDILNINSLPPSLHDDNLYQMMLITQMLEMPHIPVPAPAPAPTSDVSGGVPTTDVSGGVTTTDVSGEVTLPWPERILTPPANGTIRLLSAPSSCPDP